MGISQTAEDKRLLQAEKDQIAAANAGFDTFAADALNPDSPNYVGPGYADTGAVDRKGQRVLSLVDPQAQGSWKLTKSSPAPQNPNPPTADILSTLEADVASPARTSQPMASRAAIGQSQVPTTNSPLLSRPATSSPYTAFNAQPQSTLDALERAANPGKGDGNPYTAPGAEAPKVNRDAIDKVLGSTQSIQSYILGLAGQGRDYSAAEAQLRDATEHATANALGQARSGNRRDRAMLERQAIAEGAYNEQQAGRDTALLRAQEEDQNRRFQLDTASKAAELGLDVASAMTNIEQVDIASANNWINNEFSQLGIDKQIAADKTKDILGFTRDMAMIQFNYDQLSVDDQNEADKLMMQKYGIDQQTMVELKRIKEAGKFKWSDLLANMAGGFVSGGTAALGRKYLPD